MMRILGVVLLVALLALTASCAENGDDVAPDNPASSEATQQPELAGKTLVVTRATEGGKVREPVGKSRIRLVFSADDVEITAGCNTMHGGYTMKGDRLRVAPLSSTEVACPEPLMDQDLWIGELFENPVTVGSSFTTLTAGDVVLTLDDGDKAAPHADLSGTSWRLDTLGADGSVASAPKGRPATVTFAEKGNIRVRSYCNTGGGTVQIGDGTMEIGAIMMTQMACPDAARGKAESAMMKVLDGAVTFEIKKNELTITKGGQTLGFSSD